MLMYQWGLEWLHFFWQWVNLFVSVKQAACVFKMGQWP